MSSTLPADLETVIMDTCEKHKAAHWRDSDYRACVSIDTKYFVKFDNPRTLWPEIETQRYISEYALQSPDTSPRIAKVIHHFGDLQTMYFVMEHVALVDPPPLDLPERTAEALRWLAGVPAPPGHVFGPLGGGVLRHSFFKDYKAPLVFSSIGAVERYIAKAQTLLSNRATAKAAVESISLSDERLMFMQCDVHPSNFGVDERGNTVLMDFGRIGMLPESFAAYTLFSNSFAAVAASLGLERSSKLKSMAVISSCLWMVSNPKLSLNEDGYPVRKR
ncbi:hypothetical protein BDZ89DRAFT_1055641 [Hymenopellis radicata]|nr:hypothetical protein BDZ89DRAFT_1055641 [Hymenopellis radicata]